MANLSCTDGEGNAVNHGERFHPEPEDYCLECLCDNGLKQLCLSASCGRPSCDDFERVPKTCCTYVCRGTGGEDGEDALSAASIRLAATAGACIVIIILVIALMHKLRKHRLFVNIRHGISRRSRTSDSTVSYTSAYDHVDVGISYEPLHFTAAAPPPYSLAAADVPPPAYSSISNLNTLLTIRQSESGGIINSGCQASPFESMYSFPGYTTSCASPTITAPMDISCNSTDSGCKQVFGVPAKRAQCLGGEENLPKPDKKSSSLAVDIDSTTDTSSLQLTTSSQYVSSTDSHTSATATPTKSSSQPTTTTCSDDSLHKLSQYKVRDNKLPKRPEPIGGELTDTNSSTRLPSAHVSQKACCSRAVRSADNSPLHSSNRNKRTSRHSMSLTQYGYIDSDRALSSSADIGPIVGISDDCLLEIAACKPDRINARIRRQARMKQQRNSHIDS